MSYFELEATDSKEVYIRNLPWEEFLVIGICHIHINVHQDTYTNYTSLFITELYTVLSKTRNLNIHHRLHTHVPDISIYNMEQN